MTDSLVSHSHTDGGFIFHIPPPAYRDKNRDDVQQELGALHSRRSSVIISNYHPGAPAGSPNATCPPCSKLARSPAA